MPTDQTTLPWKRPDGETVILDRYYLTYPGRVAANLLPQIITADVLRDLHHETETKLSPRRVVSLACDLAAALFAECDHRGWSFQLPEPEEGARSPTVEISRE